MTRQHSTASKPSKPTPDFPLTPHPSGRWCKKIRGKIYYFGPGGDPDPAVAQTQAEAALAKYLEQKDRLHSGLTTADNREGLTVFTLYVKFLTTKKRMMAAGELSIHSFNDYARVCNAVTGPAGCGLVKQGCGLVKQDCCDTSVITTITFLISRRN